VGVLLDWKRCPGREDRADLRERLTAGLMQALRRNEVDVVVLNDAPPEFGRAIVTLGRRVFLADPEVDHAYVRDVQIRAADLLPWLRRMHRIKLEAIRR
jgi:hypothetical protein